MIEPMGKTQQTCGMARIARGVVSGLRRHLIQRGNRCQETFLRDEDSAACGESIAEWL